MISTLLPSRTHTRRRSATGFTLIELLVVIAIIALLVSILLPSLQAAKRLAKIATELSSQHQVGLAVQMYSTEQQGALPGGNDGRQGMHLTVRNRLYEGDYLDRARDVRGGNPPVSWTSDIWGCPLSDTLGMKDDQRYTSTWYWNIGWGNSFSEDGRTKDIYTDLNGTWNNGADDPVTVDGHGFYTDRFYMKSYSGSLSSIVLICDAGFMPSAYVPGTPAGVNAGHMHASGFDQTIPPPEATSLMMDGHARTREGDELRFSSAGSGGVWF